MQFAIGALSGLVIGAIAGYIFRGSISNELLKLKGDFIAEVKNLKGRL